MYSKAELFKDHEVANLRGESPYDKFYGAGITLILNDNNV
jgi:hypothetical protein